MPSELPRLVTRVPNIINDKFQYICKKEDRKTSNMLSKIVKEFIEQYETENGELIVEEDRTVHPKPKRTNDKSLEKSPNCKAG